MIAKAQFTDISDRRPARLLLFYRDTCPPCRILSGLAVALSLLAIRRVAVDSAEAAGLRSRYPRWRNELLLADGERYWLGPAVFGALPYAVSVVLARRVRAVFNFRILWSAGS